MNRTIRSLLLAAFVSVLAPWVVPSAASVAVAQTAVPDPQAQMEAVSRELFAAIDANRAAIRKDPEKAYPIVDKILLPNFDIDYAGQLVLAQHWRSATTEQRQRFTQALYRALLRTYGGALADFTADRFKILPSRAEPDAMRATVRTQVTRVSGAVIPVDYLLRRTDNGWKAFDVIIEGISYVKNYRTDLGAEISQRGLDAVITRLEKEGLEIKTSGPATSKSRG
jgi:phospholipid transport system substrate-binding protein